MKDINNIKTKLTNNMFNVSNYGAVVIKYVIDMRQVSGFFIVLLYPPPIKLTATI
jgi:hypothetical protein